MTQRLLPLLLLLFLATSSLGAQQPAANGTEPAPPKAPYAREDEQAMRSHLQALIKKQADKSSELEAARTSAAQSGITPQEKTKRQAAVTALDGEVAQLDTEIRNLRAALEQIVQAPTREHLDARIEYSRLAALSERVAAQTAPALKGSTTAEGELARAIREAEEELERIRDLAAAQSSPDYQDSRLYELLSDLERLDRDIRWAEQRLKLAIDEYDHITNVVFPAYVHYEERTFEALKAARRARNELYPAFQGTPAESVQPSGKTITPDQLKQFEASILNHYELHRERQLGLHDRLKDVQREIDNREDHKDRLELESERLKDLVSTKESNGDAGDAAATEDQPTEQAEYQKLGARIDELEKDAAGYQKEIDQLQVERESLKSALQKKQEMEKQNEQELKQAEQELSILLQKYTVGESADAAAIARAQAAARYEPHMLIFSMREEIKAREERLNSARRDSRQAQLQVDVGSRREQRLSSRIEQIEQEELPELRENYYTAIGETVGIRALKVVAVFAAAWLLVLLLRVVGSPLIEKIVKRANHKDDYSADEQQRARTLMTVFMTTARVVVYITAIMFAIAQFDVDYGPLLVAAGGVSLAVGFGAQSLVKDFFSGFFILLEGQFSIGDVVEINGKTGTVENLNLRTTVLRGLNGDVHVIPNGEIAVTTNQTKLWSRMILDIGVAYEENTDEISQIMEAVAYEMKSEEAWGPKLLEYALMGVNELGDSSVNVRILLKTRAGEQWGVGREYRRRIKLKFDELGVEIPWPQRVVSYKGYADMDDKAREQEIRKKRADVLRYVRKSRGEMTEEELALANMSVEERDRADSIANREVALAKEKAEAEEKPVDKAAEETAQRPTEDENLSDAEKLARKMATRTLKQEDAAKGEEKDEKKPGGSEPPK